MSQVDTRVNVDVVQLFEEVAAIYVHAELGESISWEIREKWRDQIKEEAKRLFVEEFGLDAEQIKLEVELLEGSLWAKIKPKLATIGLILSLYNGVHKAPENFQKDYEYVSKQMAVLVEKVTHGTVNSIEGHWKNSGVLYEILEQNDPMKSR